MSLRSLPRRARILSAATVAVLASAALIAASATGAQGGSSSSSSSAAATGTVKGAAETVTLLKGIPQSGAWLGSPGAAIQLVVFADLQCPFCEKFDTRVMPTLIRDYVRKGKVRIFFSGMDFVGADSKRGLKAAAAAADQNRLWHVVSMLYDNQGAENKGWLSDKLIGNIAKAIPGLDTKKFDTARKGTSINKRLDDWKALSTSAQVTSTPSFFAGTPGKLGALAVTALEVPQFRAALDKLIAAK
jgi:protein-disulfide isomerase